MVSILKRTCTCAVARAPTLLAAATLVVSTLSAGAGEAAEAGPGGAPEGATPEIIRPEDVRPGMTGYALTVFRGTEPEPFELEVIGRLERALPQQDIILVRCTDPKLRDTKVAAGMSGSPVYVKDAEGQDRLVGALAYSWGFQVEAIAGVTPITNMLGDEGRVGRAEGAWPPARLAGGRAEAGPGAKLTDPLDYIRAAADPLFPLGRRVRDACPPGGALRPVAIPLMVSGLSAGRLAELRRQLAPLGLEPVQGGGHGGTAAGGEGRVGLRPGDAMGVQLMRGDSDWTAIGTVTHVAGKRVLAFGHPFMRAGPWEAPVTRAEVQYILASTLTSFKLANSGPVVGKLVDDRQACVAAELGGRAGMVPIEVEVAGRGRARRTFRYEIVQHPLISGMLASWALADSIGAAYPWRDDSTVTVHQRIEIEDRPPLEISTVESATGSVTYSMTRPVAAALYNPFERVRLARVSYRVTVEPGNRSARILWARADDTEVKPGEEVTLQVRIRPYGGEDTDFPFTLRVPEEPRTGSFSVSFKSGADVSPDIPKPRDFGEYLEAIRAFHTYSADQLVAVYGRPTRGLMTGGRVMPALPSSVVNVLAPAGSGEAEPLADKVRIAVKTPWTLTGACGISLVLRE